MNVIITAKDEFNSKAQLEKLKRDLEAQGLKNITTFDDIGVFTGHYDGDFEKLKKLDGVEDVAPEQIIKLPPRGGPQ